MTDALEILNSSINFVAPNTEKCQSKKINAQVWLCYMKKKVTTSLKHERKQWGAEDRYSLEPEKPTGEFVIVAKFGGHALCRLASRLANVEGGREADEKFSFSNFLKNLYLSFCCCCIVLCTISGFTGFCYHLCSWLRPVGSIEFGAFAVEFVSFVVEFIALALQFVALAIELDAFAMGLGAFALKFVMAIMTSKN